jgi:effector-binding domain-containing protein
MGPAIGEVMAAVHKQGVGPAGPVYAHHFRMNPESFDFEVGVPVSEPVEPVGRVEPGELPAATVARCIYAGPYERLGDAWGEFGAWIKANNLAPAEDLWEVYIAGPDSSPDPGRWLTELNRPLVGYSAATS